ncbi:hypothetical protein EBR04_01175 [bacterium]|nr:hypothetical protein [bacterium]
MHADIHPDAGLTIQCPVCRAVQPARPACRRCHADLALFIRTSDSSRTAKRRLEKAIAAGDADAQARLRAYLRWLDG